MSFVARRSAPLVAQQASTAKWGRKVAAAAGASSSQAAESVRHGANLKEIRGRIASVANMVKITGTMKMIASARLNPAQRRMDRARPFVAAGAAALADASTEAQGKNVAIIAVTTDRGLCGGVNSAASRHALDLMEAAKAGGATTSITLIGEKGVSSIGRENGAAVTFSTEELTKVFPNFAGCSIIADNVLKNDPDQVHVVYNKFINAAAYETTTATTAGAQMLIDQDEVFDEYEWEEDDKESHMQDLSEYLLATSIWGALTENNATELAQRMSAMDNANRNAKDMKHSLNVRYNRQRQAAITTELTEIISGAAAIAE